MEYKEIAKERRRNELSEAEEDEGNMTTNAMWDPRLDPRPEKEHQWDKRQNLNVHLLVGLYQC